LLDEFVHHEEAARYLPLGLGALTIGHRRMTNATAKQRAEGSQTLKADFKADVSHAEFVSAQQLFCFRDTPLDEVLMRGLVVGLPKKAKEVITRKTRLFGNLIEAQRMVVAVVDKLTRTAQPFERVHVRFDSSNHRRVVSIKDRFASSAFGVRRLVGALVEKRAQGL